MVLSDIYQHILDHYPYFRNRGPGWRNSIRHNLSLNDCFIKSGRSANGKGHYWAIHPANVDDFTKGDFRRRKAQRKVRRHMGLSVPDDEDSNSPTPTPGPPMGLQHLPVPFPGPHPDFQQLAASLQAHRERQNAQEQLFHHHHHLPVGMGARAFPFRHSSELLASLRSQQTIPTATRTNKRLFDVESLLAPDCDSTVEDDDRPTLTTRTPTPRSTASPIDATNRTESNCSSPSVSSDVATPPPENRPEGESAAESSPPSGHLNQPYPNITAWHLQSLQNIQQINSSLLAAGGGFRGAEKGSPPYPSPNFHPAFSAWAAMSALANQEAAANLFGYATLAAAAATSGASSSSSTSSSAGNASCAPGIHNVSREQQQPPSHINHHEDGHSRRDSTNK